MKATARTAFQAVITASNLTVFDPGETTRLVAKIFNDKVRYPRLDGTSIANFALPPEAAGCMHLADDRVFARLGSLVDAVGELRGKPLTIPDRNSLFAYLADKGALLPGDGTALTKTVRFKRGKPKMLAFSVSGLKRVLATAA